MSPVSGVLFQDDFLPSGEIYEEHENTSFLLQGVSKIKNEFSFITQNLRIYDEQQLLLFYKTTRKRSKIFT